MSTTSSGVSDTNRVSHGSERSQSIQVSHTRACTNCVRAKARCSTSVDFGGKCERCRRMNKDCQPSPPMRRKRRTATKPITKASKLEEKVDGLVTLLKTATQGAPGVIRTASVGHLPEDSIPSGHGNITGLATTSSGTHQDPAQDRYSAQGRPLPEPNMAPAAFSFRSPSAALQPMIDPALEPSPKYADLCLERFRSNFTKHLPFIVLSPSVTANGLRQERPILWLCIMTVASSNSTQRLGLSREVRSLLGREVFVEGNRSMDILLAILVYAAWERHFAFDRPILVSLVQLAIAVLYDLGMDKPLSKDSALILAYDLKGIKKPSRFSRSATMEERRAYLGCFLMSSVCNYLRKGDALRWTAYSEECLRTIETQKECTSDTLLVQMVRLRLISEKVINASWWGGTGEVDYSPRPPAMFYLKSLEVQLQAFKSNVPNELIDNKTLLMEIYMIELSIYEIGVSQAPSTFVGQHNRRLECLYAGFNATRSWIDIFLDIPPAQFVGFSVNLYTTFMRCLLGIHRLLTFEHPDWDPSLVRENLNGSLFLSEMEKKFTQVKDSVGLGVEAVEDMDLFDLLASKIRAFRILWEGINAPQTDPDNTTLTDDTGDFPMSFLDNDWLGYLLEPGTEQIS